MPHSIANFLSFICICFCVFHFSLSFVLENVISFCVILLIDIKGKFIFQNIELYGVSFETIRRYTSFHLNI